jgi:hypothetical protein
VKPPNIVAFLAAIACVALIALLVRTQDELATYQAALASLKSANAELTAKVDDLERNKVDDGLMKRLLSDQRDAIKLRGEVTTLKKSLATAESAAASANAAAQRLKSSQQAAAPVNEEASPENPYTRVFTNQAHAVLPTGHGMILGGWQTAPGKQALAIAIPTTDEKNPGAIAVTAKFLEFSDEAAGKLNSIISLPATGQNPAANPNYTSLMTPEQLAAFLKTAEQTPGVDVLGAPRVMVGSGREARVSVTREGQTPNGPVTLGPAMSLTPTLGADGTTIDLIVDAKLTLPTEPSAAAANH